jgi:hypothetical protein
VTATCVEDAVQLVQWLFFFRYLIPSWEPSPLFKGREKVSAFRDQAFLAIWLGEINLELKVIALRSILFAFRCYCTIFHLCSRIYLLIMQCKLEIVPCNCSILSYRFVLMMHSPFPSRSTPLIKIKMLIASI